MWMARHLATACLLSLTFASYSQDFEARLYFRDITRGTDNAGTLLADIGDQVALHYTFHRTSGATARWGILQATFDMSQSKIMSLAEMNTWGAQLGAAFSPSSAFPTRIFWQPSKGLMYDNAVDPSDSTRALVSPQGLYTLIGAAGSDALSHDIDVDFFKFTVQPGSEGQSLNWLFDHRDTSIGMATRIVIGDNTTVDVTDNYLRIEGVPEPAIWPAILPVAAACVARRRR